MRINGCFVTVTKQYGQEYGWGSEDPAELKQFLEWVDQEAKYMSDYRGELIFEPLSGISIL